MAKPIKLASGKYRAQVWKLGVRDTRVFSTRREAESWTARRETEIEDSINTSPGLRYTLADAMRRYAAEVSPHKRGARWEEVRVKAMLASKDVPTSKRLADLSPDDIGLWRNIRLQQVAPGTVLREMGLLSAVCECARREWRWISVNPVKDVRKPSAPDHRSVLISRAQIKAMLRAMSYHRGQCKSVTQAVAVAFLLALRSGMRAGEISGLTWDRVHDRHCALPVTKTTPRDVPLTRKAMRLIDSMRGFDDVLVFGMSSQTLDAMFRKYRVRAGLSGFTFHDSRHTAATWLSRRLDVLTLCKMFGWKDPKQAMTYYNPKATTITDMLESRSLK